MQEYASGPVNTHYGPTGSSCLDYILVPKDLELAVCKCSTIEEDPLNTSDHYPVVIEIVVGSIPMQNIEVNVPRRIKWSKIPKEVVEEKYTKPVENEIRLLLRGLDYLSPTPENIDIYIGRMVEILKRNELNLPTSKFNVHLKPYWCEELTKLKKDKVYHFREWRDAGRPREKSNELRIRHLNAKKAFRKRLKTLEKEYESERLEEVITSAEVNRNHFWNLLKRERSGEKVSISTIRNTDKVVVSEPGDILEVWRKHFSELSTPKSLPNYDALHFTEVTDRVNGWINEVDTDDFLNESFSREEIKKGLSKLHLKKVPGYDMLTKENLMAAGETLIEFLLIIYEWILVAEYIPQNFRTGIQIPLYKGKDAPPLDTNSYRGITLLSIMNKLFEVLMWQRIEPWWVENQVVSQLQGACRKGASCIHTAMLLQETIATQLENNKKVFVAYYDVAKAFDGVWIDGLFFRLREMGISGKTWRLLYKSYIGFKCKVRIQNLHSDWYVMRCGIHQGGYLSLMKYTAFINSLLVALEESGLCCEIRRIKTAPLGYADDVASACTSKNKLDRAIALVCKHSNRWRYQLNAKKCAVLVYGETKRENESNAKDRVYRLGQEKVVEKKNYDHVGLKNCVCMDSSARTEEKVAKGRKALCASTGIGIRVGGLPQKVCCFIYWSIVVPIITYAAELWVMSESDIDKLDKMHRYAGRKLQRMHNRTSINTSYECLGWMRLESFINAKKLLFVRTIASQDENSIYRKVFVARMHQFNDDINRGTTNQYQSPIFDILRVSIMYNLYEEVCRYVCGIIVYSKEAWKRLIWERVWQIEKNGWDFTGAMFRSSKLITRVMGAPSYSIWWQLSDNDPKFVKKSELMIKLICNTSKLRADDFMLVGECYGERVCPNCDAFVIEDIRHIVLQCEYTQDLRAICFEEINNMPNGIGRYVLYNTDDILATMLGKFCIGVETNDMYSFWRITGEYISRMYWQVIGVREGVG